jgi:hypothetical protein
MIEDVLRREAHLLRDLGSNRKLANSVAIETTLYAYSTFSWESIAPQALSTTP